LLEVLSEILPRLQAILGQSDYRLVGTAAALLHGCELPVGDVDFLMRERDHVDAAFFEGKDVAVVGHSEMMVDELATVAKFARKVYLIPHGKLSAEDRAIITQHPKVTFLEGARIVGIEGDRFVTGVALQVDGAKETRPVSGVFVYLTGNQPVLDYLDGSVQTTAEGCLEVDPEDSSTGLPGVFAAGDVACHQVRQVVVAAAQGTLAALAVDKYLREASLGDATRV
jgi:thioredoxin reductase (NADPH)